jgi:hypothetical protein
MSYQLAMWLLALYGAGYLIIAVRMYADASRRWRKAIKDQPHKRVGFALAALTVALFWPLLALIALFIVVGEYVAKEEPNGPDNPNDPRR